MLENGYIVKTTTGEDLDTNNQSALKMETYDVFTMTFGYLSIYNPTILECKMR
jgi:hypothetical protein